MTVTVEIARRGSGPQERRWVCPKCHADHDPAAVKENLSVCPDCGFHQRIGARERIAQLADEGTFVEYWGHLRALDPLGFVDLEPYPERVREAQGASRLTEAIVAGTATIAATPCVLAVMDFGFMGGSMGSVVGEKLWRAAAAAADEGRPLVAVASSGGARMQEGALSLMQMAKTTCAVDVVNDARVPFVAVMADPCTGGVVASFVSLADICVAEPGALLYFSGPRVISQTTREQLPADFGSAERNLVLGHLDAIVPRAELKDKVANYLRLLKGGGQLDGLERRAASRPRGGRTRRLARAASTRVAAAFKNPGSESLGGSGPAPGSSEEPPA
jgi:acetyl-CoA carboxylase carboxyl transferase subunit beta